MTSKEKTTMIVAVGYVTDPPRPSTFPEGDFNMVMGDQCQFHRDTKHTMRECE
jgi:hypothetical protein